MVKIRFTQHQFNHKNIYLFINFMAYGSSNQIIVCKGSIPEGQGSVWAYSNKKYLCQCRDYYSYQLSGSQRNGPKTG